MTKSKKNLGIIISVVIFLIIIIFLIWGFSSNWKFFNSKKMSDNNLKNTISPKISDNNLKNTISSEIQSIPVSSSKVNGAYVGSCINTDHGYICKDKNQIILKKSWINEKDCAELTRNKNKSVFEKHTKDGKEYCVIWEQNGIVDNGNNDLIKSGTFQSKNGEYTSQVYKIYASPVEESQTYPEESLTYYQKLPLQYQKITNKVCSDSSDRIVYNSRLDMPSVEFNSSNEEIQNICANTCKSQGFKGFEYANNDETNYGYCKCLALKTTNCNTNQFIHRIYKFI
jgi:hypothetical protein